MREDFLGGRVSILIGDVHEQLRALPSDYFDCVVTSPPYWGLRSYLPDGHEDKHKEIGLEPTLGEHLSVMVEVFEEVRRVLKPSGTLWLNYGDCYASAPNGRSAAATKAVGNDDRTFRDKPFSTVGAIYAPDAESGDRRGKSGNKGANGQSAHTGRVIAVGPVYDPDGGAKGKGGGPGKNRYKDDQSIQSGRIVSGGYLKAKDLCMIPNRLAIALQEAGWYVRSEIIWHKPNPMPESIKDRPGSSHEKVWLLSKSERYFYDSEAVREPAVKTGTPGHLKSGQNSRENVRRTPGSDKQSEIAANSNPSTARRLSGFNARWDEKEDSEGIQSDRNLRNVWTIGTSAFPEAHFATFPPELAERCIKAGSPVGGSVLDPFGGAGTSGLVAASLGRTATLIELNPEYAILARARIEAAFMGREEGSRHMVKQLGKDNIPFEPGSLFAPIDTEAAAE